jgi:hypothetical protein
MDMKESLDNADSAMLFVDFNVDAYVTKSLSVK